MSAGVPVSEVTATDHIQVRAALVKRLGGANEAIIWHRIHYRCGTDSPLCHEVDGVIWWAVSYADLATETGLTKRQVERAIESLVSGGWLSREQHELKSSYDRTYSYRPIVAYGDMHVTKRGNGGPQEAKSHVTKRGNVPSIEEEKTSETAGARFAVPLVEVMRAELTRNGVKVQDALPPAWVSEARLMVDRDGRDPREAKSLIEWACRDTFWRANILSMPKFRQKYDQLRLQRASSSTDVAPTRPKKVFRPHAD